MKFILLSIAASQLVSGQINVCRKKNYDRGVGKIRKECREGETKSAGLCYTNCKESYKPFVTRCMMQCQGEYPVNCGAEFCAATKGDCGSIVAAISIGASAGALLGGLLAPEALVASTAASAGAAGLGTLTAKKYNPICPWAAN